jgi:predicted nuclease of predicted toxin-antitoxin system
MWSFVIDEDMPRSLAPLLRQSGYHTLDVRDVGLRGHSDADVFAYAQQQGAILMTADKGFASVIQFPPGSHAGIIVSRLPDTLPTAVANQEIVAALAQLKDMPLTGVLVIIQQGRVRLRRPIAGGAGGALD